MTRRTANLQDDLGDELAEIAPDIHRAAHLALDDGTPPAEAASWWALDAALAALLMQREQDDDHAEHRR